MEARWRELGDEALAISVICEAEVLYGLQLKQSAKLNSLYERLLRDRVRTLAVDATVAMTFSKIKAAGRKKGVLASDFDFLIAATAKASGRIIVTADAAAFDSLPGVSVRHHR